MSEMKDLQDLVYSLEQAETDQVRIETLQRIGAKLINGYEIHVGDLTIKPMLVEAYYCDDIKFPDKSVYSAKDEESKAVLYARGRQQKNQGKLFLHYNDYGIDICLTDSDEYYLSYLIKNAIVNGEWKTQSEIGKMICDRCCKYNECKQIQDCQYNNLVVLKAVLDKKQRIVFIPRKGLRFGFVTKKLAALPVNCICEYEFSLPTGYGKQWAHSICALIEMANEEQARQLADKKNGSKIEQKYWDLAKDTLSWSK